MLIWSETFPWAVASVGRLFGLCHNFRKRREISLPCFYRNTCYLVGRKTLLNNRSTVYPFLFQRQSSLTPNVLLPITLYGHPNVRHPSKTSVSLIYLPWYLFIAQASRALRRSACCWPTRSSTPRTSSCCAATTSAPLSTGYTDSTTNVSTLNGLSYNKKLITTYLWNGDLSWFLWLYYFMSSQ